MERIPRLVQSLSTNAGDGVAVQWTLTEILQNFYPPTTERQIAAALYESNHDNATGVGSAIPAVVAALRNFPGDADVVRSVCQVLVFAMNSINDPQARIRKAFLDSGGVLALIRSLERLQVRGVAEEDPFLFLRIFQSMRCILAWVNDVPELRPAFSAVCFHDGSMVENVLCGILGTLEHEESTMNGVILLTKMADQRETIAVISRSVTTNGTDGDVPGAPSFCLEAYLDILHYWQRDQDIVFCLIRSLCSLLLDRDSVYRQGCVHKAIARMSSRVSATGSSLPNSILDVARVHHLDCRKVQAQTMTMMELLTERIGDCHHEIDVRGLVQFAVRAMARFPRAITLQRSGIRIVTNLLREHLRKRKQQQQGGGGGGADDDDDAIAATIVAPSSLEGEQVRRAILAARREHRKDILIKVRCDYFRLLLALARGDRRQVWIERIRSPVLAFPCVQKQELETRFI